MSYDVCMTIDTGNGHVSVNQGINMTYNISPMIELATNGVGLPDMNGKLGLHLVPILEAAVAEMWRPEKKEAFEALNPKNGWGDFHGCREFMQQILDMCRRHPNATLNVS